MKKLKTPLLILVAVAGTLFTTNGCKKVNSLLTFGFNDTGEFEMPANIPVNFPFNSPPVPLDYNIDEELKKNNTSAELVREIKLEYMKMTIIMPDSVDFSFLKDMEVKLKKDGVGEKVAAWKYDVPDNVGREISLEVTPDALDDYLKSDDFDMLVSATLDKLVTQPVKIKYDLRITVKANVF